MINGIKESKHSEIVVLNRPGVVSTGYNYTTPIQGAGGSLPYLIYDDTFSAFDEAPAGAVAIGDLVGGYYAMIDDPPTSPGPGDDYWSASPPTADRWRGTAACSVSSSPAAMSPDNLIGAQAGSKLAAAKVFFNNVIVPISPGLKTLYWETIWAVNSKIFDSTYTYVEAFGLGQIKQTTQTHNDAITYPADWPAGSGVWTGMFAVPNDVIGLVCKKKTKTSFSVYSTGATGRIDAVTDVPLHPDSVTALITISGCTQPEYNGTFYATRAIPDDGYLYFTMSGSPGVSPATGTKSLDYWVEL